MNPKVSIIVPIYNVSAFIERCAISLFEQTFVDIEYIFVNDCTPDDSVVKLERIIENYPDRKKQTKIIHHDTNKGLASARNTGSTKSTGEFILNIDSDDYIDVEMVEIMYKKAIDNNSDIVVCDFLIEWEKVYKLFPQKFNENGDDYACTLLKCEAMPGVVNKLIKRELYCMIKPIEGVNYGEDYVTTTRLAYYSKGISKVDRAFYHYIQYNSYAYTKKISIKNISDIVKVFEVIDSFYEQLPDTHKIKKAIKYGKLQKKAILLIEVSNEMRQDIMHLFPETLNYRLNDLNILFIYKVCLYLSNKQNILFLNIVCSLYIKLLNFVQLLKGRKS